TNSARTGDFTLKVERRDRGVQVDRGLDQCGTKARMTMDLVAATSLEGICRAAHRDQHTIDERSQGVRKGDIGIVVGVQISVDRGGDSATSRMAQDDDGLE